MVEPEFVVWEDYPSQATPLNAATLNRATAGFSTALTEARSAKTAAASSATSAQSAKASVEQQLAALNATVQGMVDAGIAGAVPPLVAPAARRVKYGAPGVITDTKLARLVASVQNPTSQDTRVVVLGSSTANGGNTSFREQGWQWRLAFRAGATSVQDLPAAAVTASNTLRWWNGAVGGTTSSNYAPAAKLTQVNSYVKPNYVLHMVGSNDFSSGVATSTYQANLTGVLASIEAANPSVVNILIHQQERRNTAGTYAWSAYGDAMRNVAAAKPANRIFIDANEFFRGYDLGGANRFGLVTTDNVHMDALGHRYMADVVGSHLGIPTESDLGGTTSHIPITFPASATYTASTTLATINIPRAAYPRVASVRGVVYMRPSNNVVELSVAAFDTWNTGGNSLGSRAFQFPVAGGNISLSPFGQIYIPPTSPARVQVYLFVPAGQNGYISGSEAYTSANLVLEGV